ncbi:MAG TPA: extracellular solute-binding protein, partial [Candidatus Eisenbacteria bacterium]|nr:extracellular solute-binding protein [Candidatus Eisenbacteria bacterium]
APDGRLSVWDRIVETAKKEGKVVVSIPPSRKLRQTIEFAFTRRYGLAVEFVSARSSASIEKIISEVHAGIQYVDLHVGGAEPAVSRLLAEKALDPVPPYFVLPEVGDPGQWWGGHVWVDNAGRFIYPFAAHQTVSLWCNPKEYAPAEFHSFDDLLNPSLRGKIGISDPRVPGPGRSLWSHMLSVKGEEYLENLVAQRLFVTPDLRLLGERLSSGKIAVGLGVGHSELRRFIKAGLPVAPLPYPKEGLYVTAGYGHLAVIKTPPHPNAAKVFANWLLGRDGQEIFSRSMSAGSRRLDIATQWLKDFGVIASKDALTIDEFYRLENQSEDKLNKLAERGAAAARRLLGS